jgi:ABC-2 type transport system ATP-binding protein
MSIIEVERLAKTFRTRERAAGLAGSLRSFVAPSIANEKPSSRSAFPWSQGKYWLS